MRTSNNPLSQREEQNTGGQTCCFLCSVYSGFRSTAQHNAIRVIKVIGGEQKLPGLQTMPVTTIILGTDGPHLRVWVTTGAYSELTNPFLICNGNWNGVTITCRSHFIKLV